MCEWGPKLLVKKENISQDATEIGMVYDYCLSLLYPLILWYPIFKICSEPCGLLYAIPILEIVNRKCKERK
jgi:hypothetical protein